MTRMKKLFATLTGVIVLSTIFGAASSAYATNIPPGGAGDDTSSEDSRQPVDDRHMPSPADEHWMPSDTDSDDEAAEYNPAYLPVPPQFNAQGAAHDLPNTPTGQDEYPGVPAFTPVDQILRAPSEGVVTVTSVDSAADGFVSISGSYDVLSESDFGFQDVEVFVGSQEVEVVSFGGQGPTNWQLTFLAPSSPETGLIKSWVVFRGSHSATFDIQYGPPAQTSNRRP